MGDVFLEHIVKRMPDNRTTFMKIGIVLAAIVLIYILMVLSASVSYVSSFMPIVFVGLCFFGYRFFTSFNYEFEYIVTNGELDIDKIIAKRSRKRVFNAKPKDFEIVAPMTDKYKHEYESGNFALTLDASSSKYSKNRWFIVCTTAKHGRARVIFEPTEKMIENMRAVMPRKVMLT